MPSFSLLGLQLDLQTNGLDGGAPLSLAHQSREGGATEGEGSGQRRTRQGRQPGSGEGAAAKRKTARIQQRKDALQLSLRILACQEQRSLAVFALEDHQPRRVVIDRGIRMTQDEGLPSWILPRIDFHDDGFRRQQFVGRRDLYRMIGRHFDFAENVWAMEAELSLQRPG